MASGGKLATNDQTKKMAQSKKKCRDESDEDYMINEAQIDESEDEYSCSLAYDETEENSGKFEEEEEEKRTKKAKMVRRPIEQGRNGTVGKKIAAYVVENDGAKGRKKGIQGGKKDVFGGDHSNEKPRKETNASYRKEGEDSDLDDSDEEAQGTERKKQKRKLKRTVSKKLKRELSRRETRCPVKESGDKDLEFSGLEYTISEEERELVREAAEICKSLTTDLRSSYLKTIKEESNEKEEIVDIKSNVGKQVCGICLSEEGKRRARGTLNWCSHYFCFACIMEWSKVESRCPLCKQRFETISKTAHDSRDVIIPVPLRDQVYQPSLEELTGYLDPYKDAVCSECGQGRDDALMLLCDLCDSSAHTYCVGLGHEVPEGNWYCVVCRTTVLSSSNANVSPVVVERFDPNELKVSETPYYEANLPSVSPRYYVGVSQTTPPPPGLVTLTVSEKRRIQQQIHLILINRSDRNSTTFPVEMTQHNFHEQGTLPYYATPSLLSPMSRLFHHEASTSTSSYGSNHHQLFHSSMSSSRGLQKEQVQSMVRSHLKILSRDFDLGYYRFKYTARRSTHTILAALGMEHRWSQVYGVRTRPLVCSHRHRKWAFAGVECYSCLDIFIRSVVREIMFISVPP